MQGTILGNRYTVQEKIGSGGMATVYRGIDNVLGRTVAIKIMLPQYASDPTFAARFKQEAQAAAGLQSPYIVSVYDWGHDGDTYYIVMEYLKGTDLKSGIRTHGALSTRKTAQIAAQVCAALAVAHNHEIIHRDVKPQNIMILQNGDAKVMDFGIARGKNSHLTQTNSVLGTAHYVSPEQTQGRELTPASDLYSLGIVMYEAVTGRVPFEGDDAVTVALKQVSELPVSPATVNPKLDINFERIILKCMEKNPEDRFQSADELRRVLNAYISGRPVAISEGTSVMPAATTSRTTAMPAIGTSAAAPLSARGAHRTINTNQTGAYSQAGNSGNSKNNNKTIAIIGGVLAAIIIIIIAVLMLTRSSSISVPDVIGMTQEEATAELKSADLALGTVTTEYSQEEKNTVIDSNPDAGTSVSKEAEVDLVLSKGTEPVAEATAPDLTGMKASEAEKALADINLKAVMGGTEFDVDAEPGTVTRQEPNAGSTLEEGSTVTYYISLGTEDVEIPKVSGMSLEEATTTLEDAGFVVESSEEYSTTVEKDTVISQDPQSGLKTAKGETITLVVSKGTQPVVPDVVGDTQNTATSTLQAAGFTVKIAEEESDVVEAGYVIRMNPASGSTGSEGDIVTITVATAPEVIAIPYVIGEDEDEATAKLEGAGFVVKIKETSDTGSGLVTLQSPNPGTLAVVGSVVTITIDTEA